MGIRKKEHVIGIDRRSEPDHGFRKLAKPDIAWLLGFRKTQDSPHVFLLSLPPPDESCSLCCRRDHCCRYCYDSLDQHNARGLQCTRILRARRVFVLPYRPTACVKGSQSGMVPLQIEFVVSLEHGPPQDSLRLFSEENWKSGWLLWCLDGWHRSIFGNLVNHRVFVFPQLKRGTFDRRVTYFSKRWNELGRNEISRVGLFILNYKYPRLERWKDPPLLLPFGFRVSGFHVWFFTLSFYRRSVTRLLYW